MRSPDAVMVVDAGEVGMRGIGGHGHNDVLSFDLWAAGAPLLVDSGTYTYSRRPGRAAGAAEHVGPQRAARRRPGNQPTGQRPLAVADRKRRPPEATRRGCRTPTTTSSRRPTTATSACRRPSTTRADIVVRQGPLAGGGSTTRSPAAANTWPSCSFTRRRGRPRRRRRAAGMRRAAICGCFRRPKPCSARSRAGSRAAMGCREPATVLVYAVHLSAAAHAAHRPGAGPALARPLEAARSQVER